MVYGDILPSIRYYDQILKRRSREDLEKLSHVKRFLELFTGDTAFRAVMIREPSRRQEVADGNGLKIEVKHLWRENYANEESPHNLASTDLPLANLWRDWIRDHSTFRAMLREEGYSGKARPAYDAWRSRQVERMIRQLGSGAADGITHPIMAFALSDGCSVGCWFCALGASHLRDRFQRKPANVKLWREILGVSRDIFGKALQTSFCYWATEPFDNPNYLDFLEDYREIVGALPQTTSAVPLRDIVWTRRLMEMHENYPGIPSRFSVTTCNIMKQLHKIFSPLELLRYELIMQSVDSNSPKIRAGKILNRLGCDDEQSSGSQIERKPSTIACVSGFYVNMCQRSVQLVSPCIASEQWPLGYRIHREETYSNYKQFGDFIEDAIRECMPVAIDPGRPVMFEDGFKYEARENGFALRSNSSVQLVQGSVHTRLLGDLIDEGKHKPADLMTILLDHGGDIFDLSGTLNDLFNNGLLNDSD